MRVRMLASAAGPEVNWPVGSMQDLEKDQAKELVKGCFAAYVDQPEKQQEKKDGDGK